MSSKQIIIEYEFNDIKIENQDAKILHSKKLLFTNRLGETYFKASGVFTTADRIYVVLPWAIKHLSKTDLSQSRQTSDETAQLLETFFLLREISEEPNSTSLDINQGCDFVYLAFLTHLNLLLASSMNENVFRNTEDVLNSVRGKWVLQNDIMRTAYPLTFTCQFDECDRNHPILMIARIYSEQLAIKAASRKLRNEATKLANELRHIVDLPADVLRVLSAAIRLGQSDRRFEIWLPWLYAIKHTSPESQVNRDFSFMQSGAVSDLQFPSARFFESLISKALVRGNFQVREQVYSKILGGAYWCDVLGNQMEDQTEESIETISSQGSRADLFVSQDKCIPILMECKYKRLNLEIKDHGPPTITGFDTADRNQLLSFLLSLNPTTLFDTKNVIVVYPLDKAENISLAPELRFSCLVDAGEEYATIKWGKKITSRTSNFRITFLGIDVAALLRELYGDSGGSSEVDRIVSLLKPRLIQKAS